MKWSVFKLPRDSGLAMWRASSSKRWVKRTGSDSP
jgi:hypothetical protein